MSRERALTAKTLVFHTNSSYKDYKGLSRAERYHEPFW
jgi:hypothetical protein